MAKVPQSLSGSASPRYVLNLKEGGRKKEGEATNPFKWMIESFCILQDQGAVTHISGNFNACGFTWRLQLEPNSSEEDGEKSVSLCLFHVETSSNSVVKAIYKLLIYDQLLGQHVEKEGEDYFHNTSRYGLCCKVPLKKFNNPKSGLLVNDRCIFGVEVQEAFACKLESEGVVECLSMQKEITPTIYTWMIKDFSKLNSKMVSESFTAGNYKWRMELFPNVDSYKNFLAIFLELENPAALSSKTRVYAEFSICLMNPIDCNHKKLTARNQFSSDNRDWGWSKFLRWEDVQDPSKGFLRNDTCIIQASVAILGAVVIA
ncbi:putative inactive serine/threonine-protein kinase fnkC isoform X1 [Canna indica]|uniref:Inactive serine/threonine-protein kinase fnkC isoform X1 n=1 Tax=Canna indica TaxID=4628 RepID=A0AAQ3KE21_9LILI|nr:putative inactive serine/threonine-protein kinase fnkC isoform X1 [Canna indica]